MPITLQTAENEYKRNPDINRKDIAELEAWTLGQLHLPKISEFELILFYHSCYHDMEKTKICIEKYYTMRTEMKIYFSERDPSNEKTMYMLERMLLTTLPIRTKEGYKVFYMRHLDTDPSHFFQIDLTKAFSMVLDLAQAEEGTYPGLVIVSDLEGVRLGLIARLGLSTMHQAFRYLQEAFPVRLKGFHVMNTPPFMRKFMNLLRPLITKELMEMINLHQAPNDSIFDYVPREAFPQELGGSFDSFEKIKNDIIAKLKDNSEFFIKEELTKKVDESKRVKSNSAISKIFNKFW